MLIVLDSRDLALAAAWRERAEWAESREIGRWADVEPSLVLAIREQIRELRDLAPAERLRLGRDAAASLPLGGESLIFKADADALRDLARSIAVLAYQPGGVFVFGRRWQAAVADAGREDRQRALFDLIGPEYGAAYSGLLGEYELQGWTEDELVGDLRALSGWVVEPEPGLWRRTP